MTGEDTMTEKLYYNNCKDTEFEAKILEQKKENNEWLIVLDRTLFYPEGGGQPADKGYLNDIEVNNVLKKSGIIYHYLSNELKSEFVRGKINWEHRFDYMQQHTGQHMVSAAFESIFKYGTVSVHMSSEYTSIELATNTVSETEIKQVEECVNSGILKNLPIKYIQTNDSDINKFQLRRPSKLKGEIRLVNIENYDCVACGGVHLENTRDVKLVKFFKSEKIRGNIRTYWKIGNRAYQDYDKKTKLINRLRNVFNSDENNIENKIEQLNIEISNVKSQMNKLKKELICFYKKDLLLNRPSNKSERFISRIWDNEDGEFILKLLKSMIDEKNIIICFINKKNGIFNWLIGCSEDINVDFNEVRKNILVPLNCKGGGKFPVWQGVGTDSDKATGFIDKLSETIGK